jgi:hypothetical protein
VYFKCFFESALAGTHVSKSMHHEARPFQIQSERVGKMLNTYFIDSVSMIPNRSYLSLSAPSSTADVSSKCPCTQRVKPRLVSGIDNMAFENPDVVFNVLMDFL